MCRTSHMSTRLHTALFTGALSSPFWLNEAFIATVTLILDTVWNFIWHTKCSRFSAIYGHNILFWLCRSMKSKSFIGSVRPRACVCECFCSLSLCVLNFINEETLAANLCWVNKTIMLRCWFTCTCSRVDEMCYLTPFHRRALGLWKKQLPARCFSLTMERWACFGVSLDIGWRRVHRCRILFTFPLGLHAWGAWESIVPTVSVASTPSKIIGKLTISFQSECQWCSSLQLLHKLTFIPVLHLHLRLDCRLRARKKLAC